jgi:hypothetical protein
VSCCVMYNVVGVVKGQTVPLASRERCQGRPRSGRLSQTLDTAAGSPQWMAGRSPVPTKARLLESYGEIGSHQPCIRSSTTDHDSFSELRFLRRAEAGRSIKSSMDLRPPLAHSGYPACEPAALAWTCSRSLQYSRTRQFSCNGHLGHPMPTAKLQPQIVPPQFRIETRSCLGGLDQQPAHHRVALLADPTSSRCLPPLLSSLGFNPR